MEQSPIAQIQTHFAQLDDPRIERSKKHKLIDIVIISICAVICGADGFTAIEAFGRAKKKWLSTFLELPNGIPSHDTFNRFFAALDSEQFQDCFLNWIQSVCQLSDGEIIAIDGKRLRGSYDTFDNKAAIHMVSAWSTANGVTLGQVKVEDKSNEIVAIPELLEVLDLSGCLVTIDAIGCQSDIAQQIIKGSGDYLFALKKNQSTLYDDVVLLFDGIDQLTRFDASISFDCVSDVDKGHGRIETREIEVISEKRLIDPLRRTEAFCQLSSLIKITYQREIGEGTETESRYYISSLDQSAEDFLLGIRRHWQIENGQHWILDVAFREDQSRIRMGNAAENFGVLRRIALNLLKSERTTKLGVKNKRLKAAWDTDYLLTVLSTLFTQNKKN